VRSAKDPEKFGTGAIRGVISAEASNNGTVGGSLIPTLSFGIPGSGATAVLLGGLLMHGLRPGPDLFTTQIDITYSLFISLFVSSIAILLIGVAFITHADYLTRIDTHLLLIPVIIVLALLGGLALRGNWIDPFTLVFFGVLGYFMKKHDVSIIALVLGVVLGPIAESNLLRSLQLSGGSYDIFVSKPLSAVLLLATLAVIFGPLVASRVKRFRNGVSD
jgi:putative tricarboxylic transport membrane protein